MNEKRRSARAMNILNIKSYYFELINASTIFQTYINKKLRELIDVTCVIHLNNILIFDEKSTKYQRYI